MKQQFGIRTMKCIDFEQNKKFGLLAGFILNLSKLV